MSPLFGGKKRREKTVAILDVENGSVAAALVRLSGNDAPKLFAEMRIAIPPLNTRDTTYLMHAIEKAAQKALSHISQVAARVRSYEKLEDQGTVERAAIFLAPPWAALHLAGGTADYAEPMQRTTALSARNIFGNIPISFHPFGTAAAHGAVLVFPGQTPQILTIISGEISELVVIGNNELMGRGTIPLGLHTFLRTLVSHGGVSLEEARSYLHLAHTHEHPLHEPFTTAKQHFVSEFTDAIRALDLTPKPAGVVIVAPPPAEELFARSLAEHDALSELFAEEGTVRAMRTHHVMPYIAAHARTPDLPLMLEALFADAKFSGI